MVATKPTDFFSSNAFLLHSRYDVTVGKRGMLDGGSSVDMFLRARNGRRGGGCRERAQNARARATGIIGDIYGREEEGEWRREGRVGPFRGNLALGRGKSTQIRVRSGIGPLARVADLHFWAHC